MARGHARIFSSIWAPGGDFINLPSATQRVYLLVLSQPNISLAGVVPYTPQRWAGLASDTRSGQIQKAVVELCDRRFVLVDSSTEELWVRTFVRHDGVLKVPNMVKAMWKDFRAIQSTLIRQAFQCEYWELFEEPLPEGLGEGLGEPMGDLPIPIPIPIPTPPPTPDPVAQPDGFAEWWIAYPRKERKPKAASAYRTALRLPGVNPETIMAGLQRWLPDFMLRPADKVPMPATWLNGRSWDDDPPSRTNGARAQRPNVSPMWQ